MSKTIDTVTRYILGELKLDYLDVEEADPDIIPYIKKEIRKFVEFHVKAAIKECIESAPSGSSTDTVNYEDVVECLKDCYPLTNIK